MESGHFGVGKLLRGGAAAALSAAALIGTIAPTHAQTTWLIPASGSWSTGANWSGGVPIGSIATNITATGAPYTVSQFGGNIAVGSLLIDSPDATLSLSSLTELNNNLNVPISLVRGTVIFSGSGSRIVGSTIVGSAFTVLNTIGINTLTLNRHDGLIRATGGTLGLSAGSFVGSWDIGPGGRIESDGPTARVSVSGNGGGWTNAGQIIARNGGQVTVGNTATAKLGSLQIFDTARINLGVINNTGAILSPPVGGAFDVTGSTVTGGTIPVGAVLLRARIGAGVVGLDLKGATWEGDVNIVDNALYFFPGSTFTGTNLTALRGFGVTYNQTTTISGKTFTLTSDAAATTPTAFTIGSDLGQVNTVTLAADTVLRGTGFKLEGANNGTLINQGLIDSLAGNSTTGGLGTLRNDGRIRATTGTFGVQPGTLINNGIVEARAGTTISFSGGLTFTQGATGEMRGAGRFALNNPIPGGILRPGDDGIGTMTVQSPFGQPATFTGPTTFAIEVGGATSDQIIFNNGSQHTELGTTMVSLALTLTAAPTAQTYRIVNLPAGFQNLLSGNFVGLPNGATIAASFSGTSYNFTVQYDTKGVSLVPIAQSVPLYSVSPIGPLSFSTFTGVPSAAQTITVTSTGTGAVSGLSGSITSNPNQWSITNNCPTSLAPSATCTVVLRQSPPAGTTQVSLNTVLQITSTNAGTVDPISVSGQVNNGSASPSPATLSFNALAGTTSAAQTVTFTAVNGVASNISVDISQPTFIKTQDGCSGLTLQPGQSCSIQVAYSPAASPGGASNNAAATFQVDSNFNASLSRANIGTANLTGTSTGARSLTVSKAGSGTGTVTGGGAGEINCGATCSANFAADSLVTLTATPSLDSYFSGWSGACTNSNGSCTVTMSAAQSVTANFTAGVLLVVTSTAEVGPGTWTGVLTIINNQVCNAPSKRIEFNIPAATDPGCNPVTGVCVVQLEFFNGRNISCPNVVVDGYTQPGAVPNTATDHTNNAQLKIEFAGTNGFSIVHNNVTIRGIAFAGVNVDSFVGGPMTNSGTVLAGNYFGWRADGLTPASGSDSPRVSLRSSLSIPVTNARVGGNSPADRNLFTTNNLGNFAAGVEFQGTAGALIEGNIFNLDRNGNAVPGANLNVGVGSSDGSSSGVIRRNIIANTRGSGFKCIDGSSLTLTENEIYNVNLSMQVQPRGIEMQPVCNRNQTAPVINAVTFGATVNVQGTLTSVPNETFEIEFFHNVTPDTANIGRAEQFVGFVEVTTNAAGVANFGVDLPAYVRNVSSTATRVSTGDTSAFSAAIITPAVSPTSVVSRKVHGTAGTFDLTIDTAQPISGQVTVEPRIIGAGHTIVFKFPVAVNTAGTVAVVDGTNAAVAATVAAAGNEIIVTIPSLVDNKRATVTVTDAFTAIGPALIAPVSLGFLVGDVNNSRSVNSSDISAVKARSGQTATAASFLFDVNASGSVNSSDISAVKARSGSNLP